MCMQCHQSCLKHVLVCRTCAYFMFSIKALTQVIIEKEKTQIHERASCVWTTLHTRPQQTLMRDCHIPLTKHQMCECPKPLRKHHPIASQAARCNAALRSLTRFLRWVPPNETGRPIMRSISSSPSIAVVNSPEEARGSRGRRGKSVVSIHSVPKSRQQALIHMQRNTRRRIVSVDRQRCNPAERVDNGVAETKTVLMFSLTCYIVLLLIHSLSVEQLH